MKLLLIAFGALVAALKGSTSGAEAITVSVTGSLTPEKAGSHLVKLQHHAYSKEYDLRPCRQSTPLGSMKVFPGPPVQNTDFSNFTTL